MHCGASLIQACEVIEIPKTSVCTTVAFTSTPSVSYVAMDQSLPSDPLAIALLSATACSFRGPTDMESNVLRVLLNHVMVCPINTISHIPRSARPFLARVLSTELRKACSSVWGFIRLLMLCYVLLVNLTTAVTLLLVLPFWISFMFGLNQTGLNLFGLLYRMISKVLSLLNCLMKILINHMSYIGFMEVSTAILFKHLTQLVLKALMMIPSKVCLSITPPSTCTES